MSKKKANKIELTAEELKQKEQKLLGSLKEKFDIGKQYYGRAHKKMKMLDATDNGDLWKAIQAKFPPYQVLPDTNYVSYVKNNLLASLYTVTKSAEIVPTSEEDVEICTQLNVALEHEWDKHNVGYYQFCAGERAALLNLGITHVSFDKDKDDIKLSNVDPLHFMRDPFADCLDNAGWCVNYDNYHKSVFLNNPLYKECFKEKVINKKRSNSTETLPEYPNRSNNANAKDNYNLYIWWIKNKGGGIDEIHTIDNEVILHHKQNIVPNMYPFAELYCNLPGSSLIGNSEPGKIFANNLVFNLMNSIAYTGEYKNQRPPKFVNAQSNLNIAAFRKHGNEADRTFIVNGDASKAVHYQQFPQVSAALPNMLQGLAQNIQDISGVDGRYTGRDTGSIITTGGTEEMLNRVTLIDTPKVMNYEHYTRRLTELILKMLLEFGPKRSYLVKDPKNISQETKWITAEVDFPEIESDTVFQYAIQISSELPKNKQRVQAWANTMMEKQLQYQQEGLQIQIITPEEWLRMQDVPYKEQMLQRMGIEKNLNSWIEANTVINEYSEMIQQGVAPEDAMALSAQGLDSLRSGVPTPYQEQQMEAGTTLPLENNLPIE